MPMTVPMPTKAPGEIFTASTWNTYVRDNVDKLLSRGHRVLTVAQFGALTGPEGTKGSVAPDEVYLEVDATNGVQWHLAYESGETTYKWRFVGGPPMMSEVATSESTSSVSYVALATAGPSVAIPRSGDYDVEHGCHQTGASSNAHKMSYDIGGTGAVDADATTGANMQMRRKRKAALTPVTLTAKYKNAVADSESYANRFMAVTPVRIRHDA
jgi:hypothetical protein